MNQAALWVDIIGREPDKCLIAADWFEEQGREDIGRTIRKNVAAGTAADVAGIIEVYHLHLNHLARDAAKLLANSPIEDLLTQIERLGVTRGEAIELVDRPQRGHKGRYAMPVSTGEGFFETLILEPYPFAYVVEWRGRRRKASALLWAGRSSTGRLYATRQPEIQDVQFDDLSPKV